MLSLAEFNDITGMFMDAERMVRDCRGDVYGYMRVSTANQDCERQNEALGALGIPAENIFMDKKSGKDFDRPGFKALLEKVKEGDLVVIKTLDRFGRSVKEIQEQLWNITSTKKVGIAFIDSPFLNRSDDLPPMAFMLSSMMYLMFSFSAEVERILIISRTDEGRRIAAQNGVRFGRKPLPIPEEFWKMRDDIKARKTKRKWAAEKLGVDRKTLNKWMKKADEAERANQANQDTLETVSRVGEDGTVERGYGAAAILGKAKTRDQADAAVAAGTDGGDDSGNLDYRGRRFVDGDKRGEIGDGGDMSEKSMEKNKSDAVSAMEKGKKENEGEEGEKGEGMTMDIPAEEREEDIANTTGGAGYIIMAPDAVGEAGRIIMAADAAEKAGQISVAVGAAGEAGRIIMAADAAGEAGSIVMAADTLGGSRAGRYRAGRDSGDGKADAEGGYW